MTDCIACKELHAHFFTHCNVEQALSFLRRLDEDLLSQMKIPKEYLAKIKKKLPINIQLRGPTGQTHEIGTKTNRNVILLVTGWKDFVSSYSLQGQDMLVFFYEGNGIFSVEIYDKNGCEMTEPRCVGYSAVKGGSRDKIGKGKRAFEAAACSGLIMAKRGRVAQNKRYTNTGHEVWKGPVNERELTPSGQLDTSSYSGDNAAPLANDPGMFGSRSAANAGEVASRGKIGKGKDLAVMSNSASSRVERDWANEELSDTEKDSWSSASFIEFVRTPPCKEVISISSGSFHGNDIRGKGQISQTVQVKRERDSSDYSYSEAITKFGSKLVFISGRKPVTDKEKNRTRSQAASFRSKNPYFSKEMGENNVYTKFYLNVTAEFARSNLPQKHHIITLRLPEENRSWTVECRYSGLNRPQWYFSKGWSDFAYDNNLEVSDWCVFELPHKNKLEMIVHIFRVVEEVVKLKMSCNRCW